MLHGGLFSEDHVKLGAIRSIDRNRQPPDSGMSQGLTRVHGESGMECKSIASEARGST